MHWLAFVLLFVNFPASIIFTNNIRYALPQHTCLFFVTSAQSGACVAACSMRGNVLTAAHVGDCRYAYTLKCYTLTLRDNDDSIHILKCYTLMLRDNDDSIHIEVLHFDAAGQ